MSVLASLWFDMPVGAYTLTGQVQGMFQYYERLADSYSLLDLYHHDGSIAVQWV